MTPDHKQNQINLTEIEAWRRTKYFAADPSRLVLAGYVSLEDFVNQTTRSINHTIEALTITDPGPYHDV